MKYLIIILCALVLSIMGCSGSQSDNNDLSLMIFNQHADAWINMMPGTSSTFFVTGSLNIKNNSDSALSTIKIMKCLVYQNNEIIYDIIPELKDSLGSTFSISAGQMKKGVFTSKGVELKNEFNSDKTVDLKLFLVSLNKTKQVIIPGVKITKAY